MQDNRRIVRFTEIRPTRNILWFDCAAIQAQHLSPPPREASRVPTVVTGTA